MGLLARAYINGAGYDLKDIDGVSFLEKAYDTATTMINNKAIYEWYMHPAFADVFNENNNRNNEEALFIAAGAERIRTLTPMVTTHKVKCSVTSYLR